MADNDDISELVDDDVLPDAYPPERPLGVDERLTAVEEQAGESFGHRVTREDDGEERGDDRGIGQLIRPELDGQLDDLAREGERHLVVLVFYSRARIDAYIE